jgi:hypothetical protein
VPTKRELPRSVRIFSVLPGLLFLLSVIVQYNDPDPVRWVLIYGAAFVAAVLAVRGDAPVWLAGVTGVLAIVWAAVLLPRVLGQVEAGQLFRERGMATMAIEEAREMIGLLLVALWMGVLSFSPRRSAPAARG